MPCEWELGRTIDTENGFTKPEVVPPVDKTEQLVVSLYPARTGQKSKRKPDSHYKFAEPLEVPAVLMELPASIAVDPVEHKEISHDKNLFPFSRSHSSKLGWLC